jgi:hypothetical protein
MRLVIVTACTKEKSTDHPHRLTLADFQQGPDHRSTREQELAAVRMPAERLYKGRQHQLLMRGIQAIRTQAPEVQVDRWILSAGYGVVPGTQLLAPYEATFNGMRKHAQRQWADQLGIPEAVAAVLAQPYDLAMVLLGTTYLQACALHTDMQVGGPVLVLCGRKAQDDLPRIPQLRPVGLQQTDTTKFGCTMSNLKGEVARRWCEALAADPPAILRQLTDANRDPLAVATTRPGGAIRNENRRATGKGRP